MGELWVSREDRGFADGLDVQCERKVKDNSGDFHLNRCKGRIMVHSEKARTSHWRRKWTHSSILA